MSVKSICKKHGGYQTWSFKQTSMSVLYRTFNDSKTRWGICAGLSACWIRFHAHDDSLANKIGGGGTGLPVSSIYIYGIAGLHASVSDGTGQQQRQGLENYLRAHDIVTLQSSYIRVGTCGGNVIAVPDSFDATNMDSNVNGIPNIETEIVDGMRQLRSCYARINFGGKALFSNAGHAVSAWFGSGDEDVAFYDPNYGEFWFQNKADFYEFFKKYYRAKYNNGLMRFNREWEIIPCAKRII